jgi:hypothetical protein
MTVSAKVRETGELFMATTDFGAHEDSYRDAHSPLQADHLYGGHFFPGSMVGTSQYVEFSEAESKTFRGSELDEDIGDIRLVPFR